MLHSALPFCHPPNLAASREEFPQLRNALGLVLPAPMEPGKMVWQVYEGRGRWRDFPSALNFLVEQACVDGQGGVHYVWPRTATSSHSTRSTFFTMLQTNNATGYQRKIRRLIQIAVGTDSPAKMDE